MGSNIYPKKRGRQRKEPKHYAWRALHDTLQELMLEMTFLKGGKDHIKMVYGGNIGMLKNTCKKLLNIIELYEDSVKGVEHARKTRWS